MAATGELAHEHEAHRAFEATGSGTMVDSIVSYGAVVLAILALIGVLVVPLISIAAIAVGVGLFLEGATIGAKRNELIATASNNQLSAEDFGSGVSTEMITGIGGIVLGILSLLGIATFPLLPIAAIVLGAGVISSSTTEARLNSIRLKEAGFDRNTHAVAREISSSSTSVNILVGLGAIALGILAILGLATTLLTIIGILAVAGASAMGSSAMSGRMFGLAHETEGRRM